jgi:hypothetical protein
MGNLRLQSGDLDSLMLDRPIHMVMNCLPSTLDAP